MILSFRHSIKLLYFVCLPVFSSSQHSLQVDSVFINAQVPEYQKWLNTFNFNKVFSVSSKTIHSENLTLVISSEKTFTCKEAQKTWQAWYAEFNRAHQGKELLHEKLLETLAVLTEIALDSLEIKITCGHDEDFNVLIYGDSSGRIRLKEHITETQGEGVFSVPMIDVFKVNTGARLDSLNRNLTVRRVRLAISDFLYNLWYKGKGTPILYNVRIDTSSSHFTEFSWEFSHLSNEVLKDEGYYEYHLIAVEIQDVNGFILVNWAFTGKYGSGILFPPRKHDYKLMEIEYADEVKAYEERLFKTINEYIKKLL